MTAKRLRRTFVIMFCVISLPFTVVHIMATPDDAPISPLQHAVAAIANYFGPWGVAIVRLVDFPNAGMRAFHLGVSSGMTLLGLAFWAISGRTQTRPVHHACLILFPVFALAWFGLGLIGIADGLL